MERKRTPLALTEMVVGHKYIAQPKNGKPPSKPMKLKEFNSKGNPVFSDVPGLNSVFGAGKFNFYGYYDPATGYGTSNGPLGDKLLNALGIAAAAGFTHNTTIARPLHAETYRPGEPGALANMFSKTELDVNEARKEPRQDIRYGPEIIRGCTQLIKAAVEGDDRRVRELLALGADNEAMDSNHNATPLIWAARAGKTRVVEDLLRRPGRKGKVNVNRHASNDFTALSTAITVRNIELVKVLLDHGADPNTTQHGNPVCTLALENRQEDIFRLLINKGADPTYRDFFGKNSLDKAIECRLDSIAIELLDRGLQPNPRFLTFPNVCARGNVELVSRLLDLGIDVNEKDDGNRGIISAVRENRVDVVRLLLDRGADPTLTDDHDRNAYDYANGKPEILALLNEHKRRVVPAISEVPRAGGGGGGGGLWSWIRGGKRTRKRKARKSRKSRKV